jgi:hypothetical protein
LGGDDATRRTHLHIARKLLKAEFPASAYSHLPFVTGDRTDSILNIASHYVAAADLIDNGEEIVSVISILLRAIDIAIEKTTYDVAFEWANASLVLSSRGLGETPWSTHHSLILEIYLKLAHSGWLSQKYLEALKIIEEVLLPRDDLSVETRVTALEWKSVIECKLGRLQSSLVTGIEALHLLNTPLQLEYDMAYVRAEMEKTYEEIASCGGLEKLLRDGFTSTEASQRIDVILYNLHPLAFLTQNQPLVCMIGVFFVRHTLRFGTSFFSSIGLTFHSFNSITYFNMITQGSELSLFAEALSRRAPPSFQSTGLFVSALGSHWAKSFMYSHDVIKEAITLNAGSTKENFYSYTCSQFIECSFSAGCSLQTLATSIEQTQPSIMRSGQRDMGLEMLNKLEWLEWMMGSRDTLPTEPPVEGTLPYCRSSYFYYGCIAKFCMNEIGGEIFSSISALKFLFFEFFRISFLFQSRIGICGRSAS